MMDDEHGELELQKARKEQAFSAAFLNYMSGTGVFKQW
jgi:hypothetical protein